MSHSKRSRLDAPEGPHESKTLQLDESPSVLSDEKRAQIREVLALAAAASPAQALPSLLDVISQHLDSNAADKILDKAQQLGYAVSPSRQRSDRLQQIAPSLVSHIASWLEFVDMQRLSIISRKMLAQTSTGVGWWIVLSQPSRAGEPTVLLPRVLNKMAQLRLTSLAPARKVALYNREWRRGLQTVFRFRSLQALDLRGIPAELTATDESRAQQLKLFDPTLTSLSMLCDLRLRMDEHQLQLLPNAAFRNSLQRLELHTSAHTRMDFTPLHSLQFLRLRCPFKAGLFAGDTLTLPPTIQTLVLERGFCNETIIATLPAQVPALQQLHLVSGDLGEFQGHGTNSSAAEKIALLKKLQVLSLIGVAFHCERERVDLSSLGTLRLEALHVAAVSLAVDGLPSSRLRLEELKFATQMSATLKVLTLTCLKANGFDLSAFVMKLGKLSSLRLSALWNARPTTPTAAYTTLNPLFNFLARRPPLHLRELQLAHMPISNSTLALLDQSDGVTRFVAWWFYGARSDARMQDEVESRRAFMETLQRCERGQLKYVEEDWTRCYLVPREMVF